MTIDVTWEDKLACAKRELALRKNVYPRWVEQDRMSQGKATIEIAVMEAIVADYEAAIERRKKAGESPDGKAVA